MQAQIIGTSAESNVAPSVLITSDNVKLLFNAGEGTKRVCKEHGNLGTKITKLNYLFLTELDWSNWSGIADIVHYLNDTTTKELTIMGPTNLTDLAIATRYTLFCPEFTMKLREINEVASYPIETKDGMKVIPIVVKKPVTCESLLIINQSFTDAMEFYLESSDAEEIPHIKAMQQSAESALKQAMKNKTTIEAKRSTEVDLVLNFDCKSVLSIPPPCPMAISYCIQTPTVMPKVDVQKAKALGINPGPMIGQLSKGNSVTLSNGTVVKPEDVMNGPSQPGPMLAIVSCPSEDMLDEFVDHPKWKELTNDPSGAKFASFIHLTPASVLGNPKYISWMMKFGATADHIVANGENCHHKHTFLRSKRLFGLLNAVDRELFPSPFESDQLFVDLPKAFADSGAKITIAEPLMKYVLQPLTRLGVDNSAYGQVLEKKSPYEKIIASDSFKALKQEYDAQKAKEVSVEKYDGAEIVMLGTTSADPSDVRNESGIYLHLFERGGLIMDCGSGTYGQLFRRFGTEIAELMANLKCIWISHKHGDHHAGLIMLLEKRQQYIKKLGRKMTPVVLIAPRFIEGYVREVSMVTGVPLHYQYYHNKEIMTTDHSLKSFFANEMDLTLVRNVPVIHATDSWGLLVEHQRGWRILFSGDTRPTRSLMDLVGDKQCDLVIYEATMKDKDRELAIKKNHSTTSEALFMASKLNPYRVLLTHFSQRQSIIPVVDFVYPEPLPHVDIRTIKTDEKTSSFKNLDMHNITHLSEEEIIDIGERVSEDKVSIAFDLMSIHLSNLQTIPLTLPMFKYLYKELKNLLGKDIEQ